MRNLFLLNVQCLLNERFMRGIGEHLRLNKDIKRKLKTKNNHNTIEGVLLQYFKKYTFLTNL